MKKHRRRGVYICIAIIALLIVIFILAEVITHVTSTKVDTTEGMEIIKEAESADIKTIETKIQQLEAKQNTQEDTRSPKEIFSSAVVMGDSITEGFTEYDVLNASSVVSKIGVELDELDEQIEQVVKLNPQVIFLAYGMNDIIATQGDTEEFIEQYSALLDKLEEKLPDTKIFVNSIFPVQEQEIEKEPAFKNLEEYNQALSKLCDERQIAYIDNTKLVSPEYYEEDGVHFKPEFYPVWAARMAEVASL